MSQASWINLNNSQIKISRSYSPPPLWSQVFEVVAQAYSIISIDFLYPIIIYSSPPYPSLHHPMASSPPAHHSTTPWPPYSSQVSYTRHQTFYLQYKYYCGDYICICCIKKLFFWWIGRGRYYGWLVFQKIKSSS